MNIPKIIQETAKKYGYDRCSFLGMREGAQAFVIGHSYEEKEPPPTGLPTVLLFRDGKVSVISGIEALDLLWYLYKTFCELAVIILSSIRRIFILMRLAFFKKLRTLTSLHAFQTECQIITDFSFIQRYEHLFYIQNLALKWRFNFTIFWWFKITDYNTEMWFQSTPSRGGWQGNANGLLCLDRFNPHPRVEGDRWWCRKSASESRFNPHPRVEGDDKLPSQFHHLFQFQSTPSRGGWQIFALSFQISFLFQSTPSRGGWLRLSILIHPFISFQSTPSRGGWLLSWRNQPGWFDVSIHTLAWRVTLSFLLTQYLE